jgi:membrane dipeptidase
MVFDAHLDIAWNACKCNRDLSLTVAEIRRFEKQFPGAYRSANTVSWPELRRGGVSAIVATLLPELYRTEKALTLYQSRDLCTPNAGCDPGLGAIALGPGGPHARLPDLT